MPIRRPSTSTGHASSQPAFRSHRSNESHHAFMTPTQPPSIAYSAASATPQQKIVQALINRLKNKLPCNSGLPLDFIESDNATLRAVEALVQLSHDSLDIIAWSLSELLERLAKQTDARGLLSVQVLQSQLFVLKVLSIAMTACWGSRQDDATKNSTTSLPPTGRQSQESSSSKLPEPSPLDDSCARYILSVMVLYLRQTASPETRLMSSSIISLGSSFYDFESVDVPASAPTLDNFFTRDPPPPSNAEPPKKTLQPKHSIDSVNSGSTSSSTSVVMAAGGFTYHKTHMSLVKSSLSMNNHIGRFAGRIVKHLSASNWPVVFHRMRTKVNVLSSTSEDNPDTVDLQLMTYSIMDKSRLIQVLQVLSSLLVNMKREAQAAVASPLRKAIWNWIDLFPHEFNEALRSRGRMEGAPERTFDLLCAMQQGVEKSLWPTLTILNCISSERLSSDFQISQFGSGYSAQKGSHRKDHRFMEDVIKHANTSSKFSEVALVCSLDLCRVAFHVRPDEGEVPLRLIGSDIAHEIKVALYKTHKGKPFWEQGDEIDVPLYAEALATVFRFLPEEESIPLFVTCLEPERSDAVKIVVARAGLLLALEAPRLPWQKPLTKLTRATSRRFRNIYTAVAGGRHEPDQQGNIKKAASRPKARRYSSEALADRELLLLAILAMWRCEADFYMTELDSAEAEEWLKLSLKIWDAPVDVSVKISAATSFRLISDAVFFMVPSDPHFDLIVNFVAQTQPATLIAVVTNLLHVRTDLEGQRLWIHTAHQFTCLYCRKNEVPHVRNIQYHSNRTPAFALAEIAFLVSLTSADKGVSQLASQGLRCIAQAERQGGPVNSGVPEEERSKRHLIYEQLGDPSVVVVGRVEQQKRIRKLMRSIAFPSPIHIAVWEECYWRWRSLCESVVESSLDTLLIEEPQTHRDARSLSSEDTLVQWRNLTLFLASFGGACILEDHDPSALLNIVPAQYLPDEMRVLQNPMTIVSTFITDLTALLIADSVKVRDVARDALGSELSPRLYGKLFKHLEDVTRDITSGINDELSESFGTFLDQFTVVLKLLVEKADVPPEEVENIDISNTLVALAGFIARFNNSQSYRIRLKLCALCDCVCERTDTLTLRKDTSARHNIIDILMEWIQDPFACADGDISHEQCNLNLACLRTAVKLLDNLTLTALDGSISDDEEHVVSRLFIRYSGILLKGLDFCQLDPPKPDSLSDVLSLQNKVQVSQREADLRELITTGLSHLVKANPTSGFKHCLSLAYDQDARKQIIFARVFARALADGTKFEPSDSSNLAKRSPLCELVKQPDMLLTMAICEICPSSEIDVIISVLMNLYDTRTSLVNLLKFMIDREISHTESEASLFRGNSITTRFLSAFARIHGYNYLRSLIIPLIQFMATMPPGHGYELDPNKAAGQDVEQNQENVKLVVSSFLTVIGTSASTIPPMFREICMHIAKSVQEVWPGAKFAALGAFIFLRFISPAVVQPEIVDVEIPKDDGGVIRRGLMVIGKVVQNLANNIFFGKEPHMTVLNAFLHANVGRVTRYLTDVNKYPIAMMDDETDEWLGTTVDDTDAIVLHRFFVGQYDKIGKELLSQGKSSSDDDSALEGKQAWDAVCAAILRVGPALEIPQLSSTPRADHQGYIDLMKRYSHRNSDAMRELFVETSMPEDQPAIFILRVCNIDIEALDIELFMFHIFKTLESPIYENRLFEIILDCTSFTSLSEIPVQWIKYYTELIPSDVRQRFMTTYILNPNALTQRYLRRMYNISAGIPFSSGIRAYSSVAELLEHVPDRCAESLSYAMGLENERREVFTEATMRQSHQIRMPVILEVGVSHIRITSIKAQPLSPSLQCKSTEIISLREISDIYNVSTGQDLHEFIIRRCRQGVTLYFSSPMRETIVKTIRTAKSQMKDGQRPLMERAFRFTNVSAALLHISMLNADHDDEDIHSAAYELLGAVCTYLEYDKNPIIAPQAGFIPEDPNTFVVQLSDRLADFAPRLTLDFITEVTSGMSKAAPAQRIHCLQYLCPWIRNLAKFCDPASHLYEHSGARLRDAIRLLVDLTIADHEASVMVQKYIWSEISHLDTHIVNIVLDELMRSAIDGGVGSKRCEVVARTVATLSSINVRGRIFSKLRKILGKTSMKPTRTLVENVHWTEIATLTRLAFVACNHSKQPVHTQLYIPEIVHLVTLIAGTGPTLVRKSVYGIVLNFLQSLHFTPNEDNESPAVLSLIEEFTQPSTLRLFGLARITSTCEYTDVDPVNDKVFMATEESLTQLLVRVLEITSGSQGLLNVWRARWMSLVTSMAFQLSPAIQSRAFIVLGTLATSDVDDDFMYQILVAFKTALAQSSETDTTLVVSMLQCICKVVRALSPGSKYLGQLFWLSVALLQSSYYAFYVQATDLMRATLETAERHGDFQGGSVNEILMDGRLHLDETLAQLDQILGLSFETSFSFSLASIIFKGVRHPSLRKSADAVLRSLLRITVHSAPQSGDNVDGFLHPDALGYFLALLPLSTSPDTYERLMQECYMSQSGSDCDDIVPRISLDFIGADDPNIALLTTSFVGAMLTTAQGDDAETEILYTLLSDIGILFPDTVSMAYDGLQEKIKETFANANNPNIIKAVSDIFNIALQDPNRIGGLRGSASTLGTIDEIIQGPGNHHLQALDELNMRGLASSFQFLPIDRGHATKMITWIPELITNIIEN